MKTLLDHAEVYGQISRRPPVGRKYLQSAIAMINLGVYGDVPRYENGEPNLGFICDIALRLHQDELLYNRQPNR